MTTETLLIVCFEIIAGIGLGILVYCAITLRAIHREVSILNARIDAVMGYDNDNNAVILTRVQR